MTHPKLLGNHNTQGMMYMAPAKTKYCSAMSRKTGLGKLQSKVKMCVTYLLGYEYIQHEHLRYTNPKTTLTLQLVHLEGAS
jgi:hypothetical protein